MESQDQVCSGLPKVHLRSLFQGDFERELVPGDMEVKMLDLS